MVVAVMDGRSSVCLPSVCLPSPQHSTARLTASCQFVQSVGFCWTGRIELPPTLLRLLRLEGSSIRKGVEGQYGLTPSITSTLSHTSTHPYIHISHLTPHRILTHRTLSYCHDRCPAVPAASAEAIVVNLAEKTLALHIPTTHLSS